MSRYIDVNEFYDKMYEWVRMHGGIIRNEMQAILEAVSYIDIVRCKECRHWEMRNSPRGWCVVHQGYVLPQYFCADGEREGE